MLTLHIPSELKHTHTKQILFRISYNSLVFECTKSSCIKKKWKNHSYEMKGDVGMSLHEKERNKKMPTPRHKVTHNPIPASLFLPRLQRTFSVLFALPNAFITNKQTNKQHVKAKQRCRDGVMSDFVSWCRHLLVPFFFMK